ncbi:translation initiation factor IF-3-like [Ylistrum balloti]|uniref:translation initiation factor IF-3-like n=1 Tax=Ylistrum balloti TaxID=509963 RepID=UPI0029057E7A|nr:translation initiation factor IF-3-like [Ylistrum balloti]
MAYQLRVNSQIRARSVRVVDDGGGQLGILDLSKALEAADNRGLDLVEVAPNATPPVCRIMDFGKYKYLQKKKSQEAKKKQQTITVKEIKLRPQTNLHDLKTKTRHIRRFIENGDKVKVNVFFRGREMAHPELGEDILQRVSDEVQDIARAEARPAMEGRRMIMTLAPSTGEGSDKTKETLERALAYSYRDRKVRKRNFRRLWIVRINAAVRQHGLKYATFISGLQTAGVDVNRKMLADLAVTDPVAFSDLVDVAKNANDV